jgi:hypothetical protein
MPTQSMPLIQRFRPTPARPGHFFERQTNSHAHAKPWDVAPHFETEVVAPKKDD